jgi:hypothetical protein
MQTRDRCPECGQMARVYYSVARREDVVFCHPCDRRAYAARQRIHRQLCAELPALCTAIGQRILHHFVQLYDADALAQLYAVSDAEFLQMRNFGPKMLALFRTVVPSPVPTPVPTAPSWVPVLDVAAFASEVG